MKYPCYYCKELIELRRKDCPHCGKGLEQFYLDELFNLDQVIGQLQRLREMDFLSPPLYKRFLDQCNLYLEERGSEIRLKSLGKAAGDLLALAEAKPPLSLPVPSVSREEEGGEEEELLSPQELQGLLEEARGKAGALTSREKTEKGEFIFTSEMLDHYGEEQRDTLASLLKLSLKMIPSEKKKILGSMVEKVAQKIDYPGEISEEDHEKFLRIFHRDLSEYREKPFWAPASKAQKAKKTAPPPFPAKAQKQQEPRREKTSPAHLEAFKSLIMDNVLWVVSAFLMISGAIFFVVSSWKGLSGTNRLTLSSFSLTGLAAFLLFGSHLLKKYNLATPSGVLSWIGLTIFPFSFVILSFFPGRDLLPILLFGVQASLMAGLFFLFLGSSAGKGWESIHLAVYLFFGGLNLLLPLLHARDHLIGVGYLSVLILYVVAPKLYRAGFFAGLGVALISLLVWGGNLLLHLYKIESSGIRYLSPLLIAAAFLASQAWEVFLEEKEDEPAFHTLLHLGYGLAILGVLLSFGSQYTLLVSATLATVLLGRDALRYNLPLLLLPCYFCSVIAYFLSSLPFKQALVQMRDSAATALGYEGKLPFAYYGLTFFPYLFATAYLSWFFQRKNKNEASSITRNWVLLLSVGLLALAHLTTSDLRAALFTLPLFMGAYYFMALKTGKGAFGEIAILCTALMLFDIVRHFDLGWDGFFWGLLALTLFYHTLENLLSKREEEPFLAKRLEIASLISYCLLYVFFFKLLGHRPDELAGPVAGMGVLSVYLALWRKDTPLFKLGLALILGSYPLYFYGTPVFPFGLPLGLISVLAVLILSKMLIGQFPSLFEKYGPQSQEILRDVMRGPASVTLGVSLLLILGDTVYKGISYSHIGGAGAIALLGLILGMISSFSLSTRVSITSLGVAYLFYWRLEGLPPTGVPLEDWRGMVMGAGLYSFLVLLASLSAKNWPSLSEEKWREVIWIPTLDFSRVVVVLAFLMGLSLRFLEVSGGYSAETLYMIPLIGLSLCMTGVFWVAYFSSVREKAAFFAVLGVTTALLEGVDLYTSSHQPLFLAVVLISLLYLVWGLLRRLESYSPLHQISEVSLNQIVLDFSLYLFSLGTVCWLFESLRSMAEKPTPMVPLALCSLGLYCLLTFLWNSRQTFAFFFQIFGLALLVALYRHIEVPAEIFLLSTLLWAGLMVFLGYWTRHWEGQTYLKWQGEPFYRASITTLFLVLGPHLMGGSLVSLGLLAGEGTRMRLYLSHHGLTMGLYLSALFSLSLAATWIKREKGLILAPLVSLLIGATFYPLLSGLFKVHKPVLEFGVLALAINLVPWHWFLKKERTLLDGECATWGVVLHLGAVYLLGLKISSPLLFCALYLAAIGFCLSARALKAPGYLTLSYWVSLLAHYALALYLVPKTGAPAYQILPLFGAIALIHQALGRYVLPWLALRGEENLKEHLSSLSQNMSYLAMVEVGLYSLMVGSGAVQGANLMFTTLCAIAILYFTYRDLYEKGTAKEAYLFVFALTFSYIFFSTKTVFLAFLQGYAPHGMFLLALAFSRPVILGGVKEEALQVLQKISFYYPLLGFFLMPHGITQGYTSGLLLIGALFYGLLWQTQKTTRAALMASLFLNLSLFFLWRSMSIMDPQFYGIPLGITLVFLAQIPQENRREENKRTLETIGFLIVFGSSAFQAFQVSSPVYALMLGSLSLAGILIGRIMKWTSLINLGAFFLVVDILSFLLRSGLSRGLIAALILTLAGILVFGMALAFHDKKEGEES